VALLPPPSCLAVSEPSLVLPRLCGTNAQHHSTPSEPPPPPPTPSPPLPLARQLPGTLLLDPRILKTRTSPPRPSHHVHRRLLLGRPQLSRARL
jgi:hypothetical protein